MSVEDDEAALIVRLTTALDRIEASQAFAQADAARLAALRAAVAHSVEELDRLLAPAACG